MKPRFVEPLCVLCFLSTFSDRHQAAQEVVGSLSSAAIDEAIRLGMDEKGAAKFLQSYILQTRTGVGDGPLLGYCNTPFARVVLAASAARKAGRSFTAADIPPEALAPEFHVVLLPQQKAYESDLATMQAVVLIVHIGGQDRVVEPVDTRAAASNEVALYTGRTASGATALRFPMNALVLGSALRVTFSHVVRGSSALTNCRECLVPLAVASLK